MQNARCEKQWKIFLTFRASCIKIESVCKRNGFSVVRKNLREKQKRMNNMKIRSSKDQKKKNTEEKRW
ncbi:hypothetical protein DWV97_14650 [Ruminococcus sp. AF14-10]|nr:hypothetical protein DWV97_14650 [Ruminococcus sp. AF14-10]